MSDLDYDNIGGEDEDGWLHGTETSEEKDEMEIIYCTATAQEPAKTEMDMQNAEGDDPEEDSDEDDDDDDDNDVCVTIGTIKTGASSLCTVESHGIQSTSVSLGSEGRPNRLVATKAKGLNLDLNTLGDFQGIPALVVDIESCEHKPWRKPGADISDYFNYGFNEYTWKAYCGKQRRLRGSWENISSASSRMKVQRGRTDPEHKDSLYDHPSSYKPAPRTWGGAIDVIGGQTAALSRQEGLRRNRGNAIQVLSETSCDSSANKMTSFLPPPLPNVSSDAQLLPLPRFLLPLPPIFSSMDSSSSGPGGGGCPVSPYCSCSSGGYPLTLGSMTPWTGMIDSSEAWGYHTRASNERELVKEPGRVRRRGHDRERERERSRGTERERQRERDRGKDRSRDRARERDHCPPSLTHTRRRKDSEEEEDGRHKHKHKKAKRRQEHMKPRPLPSADQENQSQPSH